MAELNPGTPAATLDLIADLYRQAGSAEARAMVAEAKVDQLELELARARDDGAPATDPPTQPPPDGGPPS